MDSGMAESLNGAKSWYARMQRRIIQKRRRTTLTLGLVYRGSLETPSDNRWTTVLAFGAASLNYPPARRNNYPPSAGHIRPQRANATDTLSWAGPWRLQFPSF